MDQMLKLIIFKERIKMKKTKIDTFVGWIESHNPDFAWDWSNPETVKENLIEFIRIGGNINLEPVFLMFFLQGDSGMDMTMGGPETIWLDYFKKQK